MLEKTDVQVTVDLVIFALQEWELQVLLIRRGIPPFEGRWALPGGFIRDGEPLEAAARSAVAYRRMNGRTAPLPFDTARRLHAEPTQGERKSEQPDRTLR